MSITCIRRTSFGRSFLHLAATHICGNLRFLVSHRLPAAPESAEIAEDGQLQKKVFRDFSCEGVCSETPRQLSLGRVRKTDGHQGLGTSPTSMSSPTSPMRRSGERSSGTVEEPHGEAETENAETETIPGDGVPH